MQPYGRAWSASCRPPNVSSFIGSSASSKIWVFFFSPLEERRLHEKQSQGPPTGGGAWLSCWQLKHLHSGLEVSSRLCLNSPPVWQLQREFKEEKKKTEPTLQRSHGNREEQRCATQFKNRLQKHRDHTSDAILPVLPQMSHPSSPSSAEQPQRCSLCLHY